MSPQELIDALHELEAVAHRARLDLEQGRAVTGVSALRRLERRASDYARWAEEELERG